MADKDAVSRKQVTSPEFGHPVSGRGAEPKPPTQARQATGFSPNRWVLYLGVLGTVIGFVIIYFWVLGGTIGGRP